MQNKFLYFDQYKRLRMPYKETLSFRENNIEKSKFHFSREPVDISDVNFEHIISIKKAFFREKGVKQFIIY